MGDVYRLHYFDARGLVEPIRIFLEYEGASWEDCRFPIVAPLALVIPPEVKAFLPYGQVPVLEVNGQFIAQSTAIGRFLAKRFGLVGDNEMEGVKCDEIVDAVKDMFFSWMPVFREQDAEKKAELKKEIFESTKTRYITAFDKILSENGTGFLVGKSLTWADINVAHFIQHIGIVYQVQFTQEFPAVTSFMERVFNTPKIKEWMARRPVTLF